MTWFSLRLGRVPSPPRRSAAGWQRAPAVRGVQREHFHSTHHTHPSISSSNHHPPPPPSSLLLSSLSVWFKCCLEDGLQQCERPISRLWQNHRNWVWWVFSFCLLQGRLLNQLLKAPKQLFFVEQRQLVPEVSQRRESQTPDDEERILCSFSVGSVLYCTQTL